MNKKIKFTLITVWVVFSRSYDAYCTNIYTPDLSKEANPLVSILGVSSWTTLLIILCILTIYVIYSYYISFAIVLIKVISRSGLVAELCNPSATTIIFSGC